MQRRRIWTGLALAAPLALAGCSSVPDAINPISWYRDLSGVSKNDALDQSPNNKQNLEAGSKEPYPNLADVPDAPDTALTTIDRDKLQESLAADRENAKYSADQLRAGIATANVVPPPPPPTRAVQSPANADTAPQQAANTPRESSLTSPSVRSVPSGDTPTEPPPMPKLPKTPVARNELPPPPTRTAALGSGQRRAAPASSREVAIIQFADGSSILSDDDRNRLNAIAAMQHEQGGALRIIGHAKPGANRDASQQLDSFSLALGRAKAVAQELGAEGVPQNAIEIETAPSHADDAAAEGAQVFLEK